MNDGDRTEDSLCTANDSSGGFLVFLPTFKTDPVTSDETIAANSVPSDEGS